MDMVDLLVNAWGLLGLGAIVAQRDEPEIRDDDAPIRVKGGGSTTVENEDYVWVLDDEDDDNEYHEYHATKQRKGRTKWDVKAWNTRALWEAKSVPDFKATGRRVIVTINRSWSDNELMFFANGAVRVRDKKNEFEASGNELHDGGVDHYPKKIVVKYKKDKEKHQFDSRDAVIELRPIA